MVWQVMDSIHHGQVYLHTKGWIARSWKKHYCAVFKNSQHGVQRFEIYPTENDFAQGRNGRHLLLTNCVSVKLVPGNASHGINFVVQLITHDQQLALGTGSQDEAMVWLDALSRSAFPQEQPPTTPQLNLVASPFVADEVTYDTPWDAQQSRVLLIPTESSRKMGISEGPYDLSSGPQGIVLKNDKGVVEAWDYSRITWFGYGENVCAFETDGISVYEFKCAKPTDLYDRIRTKIRLKSNYDSKPNVKQAYYASYVIAVDPLLKSTSSGNAGKIVRRSSSLQSGDSRKESSPGRLRGLLSRKGGKKSPSFQESPPLANLDEDLYDDQDQLDRSYVQEPAPPRNRFSRLFRSRRRSPGGNREVVIGERADEKDDDWLMYQRPHQPNYAPPPQYSIDQHIFSPTNYDRNGYYINYDQGNDNNRNLNAPFGGTGGVYATEQVPSRDQYNSRAVDPWHSTPSNCVPSDPQPITIPKPIPQPRLHLVNSRENVLKDDLEQHFASKRTPPQPLPKPILINRNPVHAAASHARDSVVSEPAAPGDMHMYMRPGPYAYQTPVVESNRNIQLKPAPTGRYPREHEQKRDREYEGKKSMEWEERKNRISQNQASVSTDVW